MFDLLRLDPELGPALLVQQNVLLVLVLELAAQVLHQHIRYRVAAKPGE